jgi:hypothetical protein
MLGGRDFAELSGAASRSSTISWTRNVWNFLSPQSFQRLERFERLNGLNRPPLSRTWILRRLSFLGQKMPMLTLSRVEKPACPYFSPLAELSQLIAKKANFLTTPLRNPA